MGIISKFRNHFYKNQLTKKLTQIKSTRSSVDFDVAKSIGILFDATDPVSKNKVLKYADSLSKNGKKVMLLGFINTKQTDLSLSFKFFTLKDINWKMIPEGHDIEQFITSKFDILINLYLGENLSFEYISALSNASLRVGPYSENTHAFDLIIDTPVEKGVEHLIKQIDFFLNRINSPSYEPAF